MTKELKEQVEKEKCVGEHDFIVQMHPFLTTTGTLDYVFVVKVCRLCGLTENETIERNKPIIHINNRKK